MNIPAEDSVIQFKTNAWQSVGHVAWYADRVQEKSGTNALKNEVELSHIRANIVGKRIIDVGIGTGRASLPLLREGFGVVGVDASQAMLDRCRQEAAGLPIDLHLGDLTKLPVENECFDSAIALNVVSHFPNWREALADWARVIKPQGRIVFDVHSSDHLCAVAAAKGCKPEDLLTRDEREKPEHYFLRIGIDDVASAASELGLCVVALLPYGAIFGGGNLNYWLRDSLLWGEHGDRALSWMAVDDRLYSFGAFLEQTIIARMSTHATPRFIAVLEKRKDDQRTQSTIEYQQAIALLFASSEPTLAELRDVVGNDVDSWGPALAKHLEYPTNSALLAMILSSKPAVRLRGLIQELIGPRLTADLYDANERKRIDEAVHALVRTWHKDLVDPKHFSYKGVDLGPSLEYDLMHDVLMLELFGGNESMR